jgi:hypothetical protein
MNELLSGFIGAVLGSAVTLFAGYIDRKEKERQQKNFTDLKAYEEYLRLLDDINVQLIDNIGRTKVNILILDGAIELMQKGGTSSAYPVELSLEADPHLIISNRAYNEWIHLLPHTYNYNRLVSDFNRISQNLSSVLQNIFINHKRPEAKTLVSQLNMLLGMADQGRDWSTRIQEQLTEMLTEVNIQYELMRRYGPYKDAFKEVILHYEPTTDEISKAHHLASETFKSVNSSVKVV